MNLIENAKKQIDSLISDAYNRAAQAGELTQGAVLTGTVEIPRDTKNGDYASNHAMTGANTWSLTAAISGALRLRGPAL